MTPVHIVISGSHEAVAEVVMAMRQVLYLQIDLSTASPVLQSHGVGSQDDLSVRPFLDSPLQDCGTPDTTTDGYDFALYGITDLDSYSRFAGCFNIVDDDAADRLAAAISRAHPEIVVAVA